MIVPSATRTLLLLIVVCVAGVAPPQYPEGVIVRRWIAAALAHEPGAFDQPLLETAAERLDYLDVVRREVGDVLARDYTSIEVRNSILRRGALLERIRPYPEDDEFVRLWYRAVAARLQAAYLLGSAAPHLDAARNVFPRDPVILFYAGAMHEALASTRFQNMMRTPPGLGVRETRIGPGPATHLRSAERLLRESIPPEAR